MNLGNVKLIQTGPLWHADKVLYGANVLVLHSNLNSLHILSPDLRICLNSLKYLSNGSRKNVI